MLLCYHEKHGKWNCAKGMLSPFSGTRRGLLAARSISATSVASDSPSKGDSIPFAQVPPPVTLLNYLKI
jgi:hypothetical protein